MRRRDTKDGTKAFYLKPSNCHRFSAVWLCSPTFCANTSLSTFCGNTTTTLAQHKFGQCGSFDGCAFGFTRSFSNFRAGSIKGKPLHVKKVPSGAAMYARVRQAISVSLRLCLNISSSWNLMRGVLQPKGRHVVERPHPNDFADMLEDIFSENFGRPMGRPMLTEAPWSMNELRAAIRRAKTILRKVIWKHCWMYFVMLAVPVKSPHRGKQQSSRCFQNLVLRNLQSRTRCVEVTIA